MIRKLYKKGLNFTSRVITNNFSRKNFKIHNKIPLISFTFDDFPQSAIRSGLELLNKYNLNATFYISFGLLNKDTVVGKICNSEDIERIVNSKNELGCHTYNHRGAFEQSDDEFENSIIENQKYLEKNFSQLSFKIFAYPKGQIKISTKYIVQKYFICSRSSNPGINKKTVDLNLLKGTRIYGDVKNFELIKKFIDLNLIEKGWLIFYTHDVAKKPSPFGCTPALFEEVLKYSVMSSSKILTVGDASTLINFPGVL